MNTVSTLIRLFMGLQRFSLSNPHQVSLYVMKVMKIDRQNKRCDLKYNLAVRDERDER